MKQINIIDLGKVRLFSKEQYIFQVCKCSIKDYFNEESFSSERVIGIKDYKYPDGMVFYSYLISYFKDEGQQFLFGLETQLDKECILIKIDDDSASYFSNLSASNQLDSLRNKTLNIDSALQLVFI